jgi:hypothetical protein
MSAGHKISLRQDYASNTFLAHCECGWGYESLDKIEVGLECRRHEKAWETQAEPPKLSAVVSSISAAKFKRTKDTREVSPLDALEAAKEWILSLPQDERPSHLIVFTGANDAEGNGRTRFFQAGDFGYHAQLGLCQAGTRMIDDS